MSRLAKPAATRSWNIFKNILDKRLRESGLLYEDLWVETEDVTTALKRCSPEVLQARERRIRRAFDASTKKITMPEEVQQNYNPFESYLEELRIRANEERLEKELYNAK